MGDRKKLGYGPFSGKKVRAIVWLDQLHTSFGLQCAGGNFSGCDHDTKICKGRAGFYLNTKWDTCPVRVILDDSRMTAAMQLERCSKISPLSNWPDSYSAWVPELVSSIRAARIDRENSEKRK